MLGGPAGGGHEVRISLDRPDPLEMLRKGGQQHTVRAAEVDGAPAEAWPGGTQRGLEVQTLDATRGAQEVVVRAVGGGSRV